jgi:hypothetical protein
MLRTAWAVLVAALALASLATREAGALNKSGAGYTATDSVAYSWLDIKNTGTAILQDVDDAQALVPIGFNFSLAGNLYNALYASSNGTLSFGAAYSGCNHTPLPTSSFSSFLMAPYWDDLYFRSGSTIPANSVYYQTLGAPGSRQLVVQWQDADHYDGAKGAITFQAILNEGTNAVKYQYQDVNFENSPSLSKGASATVGIQNNSASALQWSYNQTSLSNNYAIQFAPLPPAPVPCSLGYTCSAKAMAWADAVPGSPGYGEHTATGVNQMAQANAHATAMGEVWEPDPMDPQGPGMWWHYPVDTETTTSVGGSTNVYGALLSTYLSVQGGSGGPGFGMGSGNGDLSLAGTLGIGTSAQFPDGAGGLTVHVGSSDTGTDTWSLRLSSTDPDNPLDVLFNHANPSGEIPVLAGQTLNLLMTDAVSGSWWGYTGGTNVDLILTPEPATLSLLALGGLMALRRRR